MNLIDLLVERKRRNSKFFRNPVRYAMEIKRLAKRSLPDARVFLFGSVVHRRQWAGSDIDVLIVSSSMPADGSERSKLAVGIRRKIGFTSPFELHLVTPPESEWYRRFIDKRIEI